MVCKVQTAIPECLASRDGQQDQQLSQNALLVDMVFKVQTAIPECLASKDGM